MLGFFSFVVGFVAVFESVFELFLRGAEGPSQFRELGAAEQQRDHGDDDQELPADDLADYRDAWADSSSAGSCQVRH